MQYRYEEIDQLAKILEAEAAGHRIEVDRALSLAARLSQLCPDISRSMSLVIERFDRRSQPRAA
ncbi:hypothetical protein [Paramagnetospirillum kuznetsovii]|nr:hypothetical protein [Paramagnetospirillum kuznetsovii]